MFVKAFSNYKLSEVTFLKIYGFPALTQPVLYNNSNSTVFNDRFVSYYNRTLLMFWIKVLFTRNYWFCYQFDISIKQLLTLAL